MNHRICVTLALSTFLFLACGSEDLSFLDVAGIPPGDGAGDALTGTFAAVVKVNDGGCEGVSSDEIPQKGDSMPMDIIVLQDDGALKVTQIEGTALNGAINFDDTFEVGGSSILSIGEEEDNVQRLLLFKGRFSDADTLEGNVEETFVGKVDGESINCSFSLNVTANRK